MINDIREVISKLLPNIDMKVSLKVDDLTIGDNITFHIEPYSYNGSELDGMQILFEDGLYEVSEFMAGVNEDKLRIFLRTKSLRVAIKNMLRGNKNRTAIETW